MPIYRKYWDISKLTIKKFAADYPVSFSAGIAFYTIFSLPAMLLISIWVAASIYDDALVRQGLIEQVQSLFGKDSAEAVRTILSASSETRHTWWAKVVGIGTLILSATTVFVSLQEALNNIWGALNRDGIIDPNTGQIAAKPRPVLGHERGRRHHDSTQDD